MQHRWGLLVVGLLVVPCAPCGEEKGPSATKDPEGVRELRALDARVLAPDPERAGLLFREVRGRLRQAGDRETALWEKLKGKVDWETYRDERIGAMRASLGAYPRPPADLNLKVVGSLEGDDYRIDKLTFQSRPGLLVTGNLYRPARSKGKLPGIVVCHSHHNPKTHGELQDMGVSWARAGCVVLVIDQLGHGERRQHPFRTADDFSGPFRVDRQDYYFRYNVGLQLSLIGDSLMGWMTWDLSRCIDLLLARPDVDPERIILLGAVAGGGDPAAVTAALDLRVRSVVPFNFGSAGAGSGSWESTRNLDRSAADGFLPWVIVGAAAPRRLILAHEFAWDKEKDPAWARLKQIYAWYEAPDVLASMHGKGAVTGKPPEATHCNNIGAFHRVEIHALWQLWFGVRVTESRDRRPSAELACLERDRKLRMVHELARDLADERLAEARKRRNRLSSEERTRSLRRELSRLLGVSESPKKVVATPQGEETHGEVSVERVILEGADGVPVPLLVLTGAKREKGRRPVVVGLAQQGKQLFLKERAAELSQLIQGGVTVVLPDLRGMGETRVSADRGRMSGAAALASSERMLGRTVLGGQLDDLRGVLHWLRERDDVDPGRITLWGDSFAEVNAPEVSVAVPLDASKMPALSEPGGGLLALLGGLFDERVAGVAVRGSLVSYRSVLDSPFLYLPGDAIIPGMLKVGDVVDVVAALAPRRVRIEGSVDGLNKLVARAKVEEMLGQARLAYRAAKAEKRLTVGDKPGVAEWVLGAGG